MTNFTNVSLTTDPYWHLARRASLVPTIDMVNEIKSLGIPKWLDKQLDWQNVDDTEYLNEREKYYRYYGKTDTYYQQNLTNLINFSDLGETSCQAVYHEQFSSKRYIKVAMQQFWYDNFNITTAKASLGHLGYLKAINENSLGKFKDILKTVMANNTIHDYLDNSNSTKEDPNQNLAREIMELHTLGVNGGYSQQDVITVSRLLTGAIPDRYNGTIEWDVRTHYIGNISIINGQWKNNNNPKNSTELLAVINSFLDFLATHPSTAQRICRRLCVNFVKDDPSDDLVNSLAKIYLANDSDVKPVLKALFTSTEFNNSVGQKIKKPQNFMANMLAVTGRKMRPVVTIPNSFGHLSTIDKYIEKGGHKLFRHVSPDGYPLESSRWYESSHLFSAYNMTNMVDYSDGSITNAPDYAKLYGITTNMNYLTAIKKLVQTMTGFTPTNEDVKTIAAMWYSETGLNPPNIYDPPNIYRINRAVRAVLASPYFLVS